MPACSACAMNDVFHAVNPAVWSISAEGAGFAALGVAAALAVMGAVMVPVGADGVATGVWAGTAAVPAWTV